MPKQSPPDGPTPPLPPLSPDALNEVNDIERSALGLVQECARGARFNHERAIRSLRTCIVQAFSVQLHDYLQRGRFQAKWVFEIYESTIRSMVDTLSYQVSNDQLTSIERQLRVTLADWIVQKAEAAMEIQKSKLSSGKETKPSALTGSASPDRMTQTNQPSHGRAVQSTTSRAAVVDPLLASKGWSILDWANAAKVAYHTARDYHDGIKSPYASTRLKLAQALEIEITKLPE